MLRPPTHRADAPIVYVHPSDPAWDHERIARELKEYAAADPVKPPSQHPVHRYWDGYTRYDVDAVAEYLKPDATRFYFKRIGVVDWQEIESMKEAQIGAGSKPRRAVLRALSLALTKIENGPTLVGEAGALKLEDIDRIAALNYWDDEKNATVDILYDVGVAAYTASMPLSKAEKKA